MQKSHSLRSKESILDKYSVKLMSRAIDDLEDIYVYIAKNLLEPETALNIVEAIESEILNLDSMPYRCPERRNGLYANKGYRQLLIKNYIIIFRVDEKSKTVIIVTVRYSKSQF